MKKVLKIFGLLAISQIIFISCNDEDMENNTENATINKPNLSQLDMGELMSIENQNSRTIWMSIILSQISDESISLVRDTNGSVIKNTNRTKDSSTIEEVTFSSKDVDVFFQWVQEMLDKGYTVTIRYDKKTECYFGSATI